VAGSSSHRSVEGPPPIPIDEVRSAQFDQPGFAFMDGEFVYRTTGESVGHGGMGNAFVLMRRLRTAGID
jgi:hypothetical protein